MANVKITALSEITPSATDVLPVVDVSANVTSKTTVANIPKNASNGTAATPSHSFAGDTDTGMWRKAADTLAFSTGAAQIVELTAAGNLLIGGTLPSAPNITLASDGTATFITDSGNASNVVLGETGRNPFIQLNRLTGTGAFYNHKIEGGVADLNFHVATSTTSTSKLRINSSGNVRLGSDVSSTATTKIYLNGSDGSATFEGNLDVGDFVSTLTDVSGARLSASGTINVQRTAATSSSGQFYAGWKGTDRTFFVSANGGIKINGTTSNSTNPTITLDGNGSSTFQGELTINRPTGQASALVIRENNVEKIKLKPNGQALFSGPVSIGGTAAINTIDVYEEGSITPSVEFGGSATGITYNSRIGKFTRIGDQVTIYVFVALSDKGTSTGNAIIKTLPFTSANIVASNLVGWPGVVAGRQQNFSGLDVNNPNIGITVARNGVGMLLRTVSGVNLTDANFTNGSIIEYQLTYTTN